MAVTRRTQILMDPDEYERLALLAERRGVSVAELIRRAVRETYGTGLEGRQRAAEEICAMELPVADQEEWEREIADAHRAGLPG